AHTTELSSPRFPPRKSSARGAGSPPSRAAQLARREGFRCLLAGPALERVEIRAAHPPSWSHAAGGSGGIHEAVGARSSNITQTHASTKRNFHRPKIQTGTETLSRHA